MDDSLPLTFLFAAVGVAVWIGGNRPALLVVVLGYLACDYLFIPPRGQLDLSDSRDLVGLILYLASASIIILWEAFPALIGTKLKAEYRRAVAAQVTVEFEPYRPLLFK